MRRKRFNRYNYNRTASDMSASSIILTLVLLGTIVAGHTDHPVFWLLVGPAPLGIGFTAIMFFRYSLSRDRSLPTVPEQEARSSGGPKQVIP
jgi:hypothetical protein